MTANVALVAPAATVTLPGTVTFEVLELERLTDRPPPGAVELNVTVPVLVVPPATEAGDRLIAARGGVTVRVACSETVPAVAVTVIVYCDV